MSFYPVILSGGAGTRLWPLSSGNHPKQFLPLVSNRTMIQETLLRLEGMEHSEPVVVCNEAHRFIVAEQMSQLGIKNQKIMLEPVARNTAPAIAAACHEVMRNDSDAVVIILPSDHVIKNKDAFQQAVKKAVQEAEKGFLVTFGIVPTEPNTGYGYIKTGKEDGGSFELERFVEKPNLEKARKYLADGNYSWNSGMFVFKASKFLDELKSFEPEMYSLAVKSCEDAAVDTDFIRLDKNDFEAIKGNSIDYAVMEKTKHGRVVKLDAGWNDVGSWSALWEIKEKDSDGNVLSGDVMNLGSRSCYINSKNSFVAAIGLEDIVVVSSEDGILISRKDKVQDVKIVAEELKKRK